MRKAAVKNFRSEKTSMHDTLPEMTVQQKQKALTETKEMAEQEQQRGEVKTQTSRPD